MGTTISVPHKNYHNSLVEYNIDISIHPRYIEVPQGFKDVYTITCVSEYIFVTPLKRNNHGNMCEETLAVLNVKRKFVLLRRQVQFASS